ncbi:MAG: response regulator transcription factor [Lachnospiraceae bacterium]
MKLLIVDDEKLTREGLCTSISWEKFGISQVFQGDDGIHGLELIKQHHPEIVLTDVRMPRMDGITMAERIQELYPDTSVIFMSGYSDKEYLKAAIKLKVIRYVEKPIDVSEVEEAIGEALVNIEFARRTRSSEQRRHQENRGQLALSILYEFALEKQEVRCLLDTLDLEIEDHTYFFTLIIEFLHPVLELRKEDIKNLLQRFGEIAKAQKRKVLYALKGESHLILHVYHNEEERARTDTYLSEYWQQELNGFGHFFIARGRTVQGAANVYQSYNDAVILLQSVFFHDQDSILVELEHRGTAVVLENRLEEWKGALRERDEPKCNAIITAMYNELQSSHNLLPSQVKDIYYKYFMQLEAALNQNYALAATPLAESETIWGRIEKCKTLSELSRLLLEQTGQMFKIYHRESEENPIILQIKDFIRKNCAVDTLSVKDISEQVYLSPSYVCTLFKNETGQTLNQCITEYRLELAKEMLENPRNKISDIAGAAGYGDANYFSKTFKKNVGLTPSEYREKMLK